jgi:hypothetical protein
MRMRIRIRILLFSLMRIRIHVLASRCGSRLPKPILKPPVLSGGKVRGHNRDVQEAAGGDGGPEGPDQVPGGEEHRVHPEEPGSGGRAGQPQQETAAGLP